MPYGGFNGFAIVSQLIVFLIIVLPIILGFTLVRVDANRHGQPGWLWALLTIPFSWFVILAYVIVRAIVTGMGARA